MRYVNSLFVFFVIFDNEKSRKLACKGLRLRSITYGKHKTIVFAKTRKCLKSFVDRQKIYFLWFIMQKVANLLARVCDFAHCRYVDKANEQKYRFLENLLRHCFCRRIRIFQQPDLPPKLSPPACKNEHKKCTSKVCFTFGVHFSNVTFLE